MTNTSYTTESRWFPVLPAMATANVLIGHEAGFGPYHVSSAFLLGDMNASVNRQWKAAVDSMDLTVIG